MHIVVLIPCYNEALTIGAVIQDFAQQVPGSMVHVFDNNSSDNTTAIALAAGAQVHQVPLQGKGNVIRRMFADIDADAYVLVDGDSTYDAGYARKMIDALVAGGLDMVVGTRQSMEQAAYRTGHQLGNFVLTRFVAIIFGHTFTDMLSGYRVFSRRYVKSFPAHSAGFEIETELTVHALELRMPVAEIMTPYASRPVGSISKLNTYQDGLRILSTILKLFKAEKPILFFSIGCFFCAALSVGLAIPVFDTYLTTGLVPRLPTAILAAFVMLVGLILFTCGIILDTVTRGRRETKRLAYLAVPGPKAYPLSHR